MIEYIPKKILIRDKNGELKPILALKGDKGEQGDKPVRGQDYYTTSDIQELKDDMFERITQDVVFTVISSDGESTSMTFISPIDLATGVCNIEATFIDNSIQEFNLLCK